jgi:hypothetical protein
MSDADAPTPIRPISTHPERDWPCHTDGCPAVTNDLRSFVQIGTHHYCAACAEREALLS